jgi:hypothetical protein
LSGFEGKGSMSSFSHTQWRSPLAAALGILLLLMAGGCATIRVTDPKQTATEQFLMSVATARAIDQISAESLRDRLVYLDTTYFSATPETIQAYFLGAFRAKLLASGVRLVPTREQAKIILELRSQGTSIDRLEYLLGLPALSAPTGTSGTAGFPVSLPELAIYKQTTQSGYSSVAYVAYWADSGEVVASSGPFVGKTFREDYWLFGYKFRTLGNIPPAESGP